MKPGTWRVTLKPDTPSEIIDRLRILDSYTNYAGFGSVLFTPTWLDPAIVGVQGLLDNAYYHGRYITLGGRTELSGDGIEAWLGDSNGKGALTTYNLSAASFTDWFDDARTHHTTVLPLGSFADPGGTWTWNSGTNGPITNRDALNQIGRAFGTEWRLNPDWTIDGGTEATIYGSNPVAIFSPNANGAEPGQTVLSGELDIEDSVRDYIFQANVTGGAGGYYATEFRGSAPAWSAPWYRSGSAGAQIRRRIDSAGTPGSNADLDQQALVILLFEPVFQTSIRLSVDNYDPSLRVCGKTLDLWAPEFGVFDITKTQQWVAGEMVRAMRQRVVQLDAPVVGGVYFFNAHSTEDFVDIDPLDLTRFVDFRKEPKQASITCGTPVPGWERIARTRYSDWLS